MAGAVGLVAAVTDCEGHVLWVPIVSAALIPAKSPVAETRYTRFRLCPANLVELSTLRNIFLHGLSMESRSKKFEYCRENLN